MIICFSGTGNSRLVAGRLASLTGEKRPVTYIDRRLYDDPSVDASGDSRIIWVFPVYSWGVPPVVVDVIRRLRLTAPDSARHYMVATCGDDAGLTAAMWRRAVKARGWHPAGAFTVIMPNTYVMLKGFDVDSPDVAGAKLDAMEPRVADVATAIMRGYDGDDCIRGSFPWIKSRIVYPVFVSRLMSPKGFHVLPECIGCGKCAAVCPMSNITIEGGRPEWGSVCAFCSGCYHVCPVHAVAYGKATSGKGQKKVFDVKKCNKNFG